MSRFADEIAREEKAQVFAIRIDCSDTQSVREAFEGVLSLGFVEVLVYNAYQPIPWQYGGPSSFSDIRIDSFQKSLAVSSVGAFHCAQQVHTLLFTLLFDIFFCNSYIEFSHTKCAFSFFSIGVAWYGRKRKRDHSVHRLCGFLIRHRRIL